MTQMPPDDRPPDGLEAEAQREETLMPWIWGALGLLVVIGIVIWLVMSATPLVKKGHSVVVPSGQSAAPIKGPS